MGIVKAIPELEDWLDHEASSWESLFDAEYNVLVHRWTERFAPLIASETSCLKGDRAVYALEARLPADVVLISGIRVLLLANMGGRGASAYAATGLRGLRRDLANELELVLASKDFAWSCVFSHESGGFSSERLWAR